MKPATPSDQKQPAPLASPASPRRARGPLGRAAGVAAESALLRRGKQLWEKNATNWNLPMSKWDKLWAGAYLILRDYSRGEFPPVFEDQQQAYLNEINYESSIPGMTAEEVSRNQVTKPFWFGSSVHHLMGGFLMLLSALEAVNVRPPARVLELGAGSGWTAEFLAHLGFRVVGTTIAPQDVAVGQKRAETLRLRGAPSELHFLATPMESVAEQVKEHSPFDAAFVFEALHHAFDWRAAVRSSFACLRPGGWLPICNEPNVLHTAVSYRVARLSNTHEIGFSKGELVSCLRQTGFQQVRSIGKRPHLFFRPHWLLAQK